MRKFSHRFCCRNWLSVIDAGFGGGQQKAGVEHGCHALFDAGLKQCIAEAGRSLGCEVRPANFASFKPPSDPRYRGMYNPRWVSAATSSISNKVFEQASLGKQVLTLGGDHSIAIGTLTGSIRALRGRSRPEQQLGVVYIDAHADLNLPEDSASGNIHGMALAFASRLALSDEPGVFDWITEDIAIDLSQLVYIGLRDVDDYEKQNIAKHKIKTFWMEDVRKIGIEEVIRRTLKHLKGLPIHVSYDIDSLDPYYAPSTGLPVLGGLTLMEGQILMRALNSTGRLVAMDVVEINPQAGTTEEVERTLNSGLQVIRAGLEHV